MYFLSDGNIIIDLRGFDLRAPFQAHSYGVKQGLVVCIFCSYTVFTATDVI